MVSVARGGELEVVIKEGRIYAGVVLDAFLDGGTDLELALEGGRHWLGW